MPESQMPKGVEHEGHRSVGFQLNRCQNLRCRKALSTSGTCGWPFGQHEMPESQMPKGVEHGIRPLYEVRPDLMPESQMPKGVEHWPPVTVRQALSYARISDAERR